MNPLVSVIMPVFNGEMYIQAAIRSVLAQTYENIELLVINDGSTDASHQRILEIRDQRLRYFEQRRQGVSVARNVGLQKMSGEYFCFLDADDLLTPNSILSRLRKFGEDSTFEYVDGSVRFFADDDKWIKKYIPCFSGEPLTQLFLLNGKCFAGLTWMVKRREGVRYAFKEHFTHGEDLFFCMELARHGGAFNYVTEETYLYRQHDTSSMRNISALEKGYWRIYEELIKWPEFTFSYRLTYRSRVKKFMILEYLSRREFRRALLALTK